MFRKSSINQQIAVFGESGSGKTTLLSVFYGQHQARNFFQSWGYSLLADDTTQGQQLIQAYHLMEDSMLPPQTRFQDRTYRFRIRHNELRKDAGQILWHDYPGEWWSETQEGKQGELKIKAFRNLLCSDIALFLVDGQRLKDSPDNYLPRLFSSFRDELMRLREHILVDDKPFKDFPRTWLICLSKADLFPEKDVDWFEKQVLKKAGDELTALREEICSMVSEPECVALGDDFLLLSSAQFDSSCNEIKDMNNTKGLDALPPLSMYVPFCHAVRWAGRENKGRKIVYVFMNTCRGITKWLQWLPLIGRTFQMLDQYGKEAIDRYKESYEKAVRKGAVLEAVIAGMGMRLADLRSQGIYRSRRV